LPSIVQPTERRPTRPVEPRDAGQRDLRPRLAFEAWRCGTDHDRDGVSVGRATGGTYEPGSPPARSLPGRGESEFLNGNHEGIRAVPEGGNINPGPVLPAEAMAVVTSIRIASHKCPRPSS
jgi:hypothetical protein